LRANGASFPGLPLAKIAKNAKIPSQSPVREAILFRRRRIKRSVVQTLCPFATFACLARASSWFLIRFIRVIRGPCAFCGFRGKFLLFAALRAK